MNEKTQQVDDVQQIFGHIRMTIVIDAKGAVKYSVHGNDMVTLDGKHITDEEAEALLNKTTKGDEQ